jgi:hypothetical protein
MTHCIPFYRIDAAQVSGVVVLFPKMAFRGAEFKYKN